MPELSFIDLKNSIIELLDWSWQDFETKDIVKHFAGNPAEKTILALH